MLSEKRLEEYRQMTPAERLRLTFESIDEGWRYLEIGTEDEVRRKRQLIQEQNDPANRHMLEAFARTRKADE